MRISRFLLPTVVLAGALALAGCGGGDDPMDDMDMDDTAMDDTDMDEPDPEPEPEPEVKNAKVPDDRTVLTGLASLQATLQHGETKRIGSLWYTCDGGTCSINIPAESAATSVDYTGSGMLTIRTADHRVASAGGGADQPAADADDPLSEATLLEATDDDESSGLTLWTAAGAALTSGGEVQRTLRNGESFNLELSHLTGALYWGQWERYTDATDGTEAGYRHGSVWGGQNHYGKKPVSNPFESAADSDGRIDHAHYSLADAVEFRYSTNGGKTWEIPVTGDVDTADLDLRADFMRGKIGGTITGEDLDDIDGSPSSDQNVNDIRLMESDITSTGTFSGNAEFSASGITRQRGSWDGGFFGDDVGVSGTTVRDVAPSHVAGEFSVNREKITNSDGVTTQTPLFIEGAFGAAMSDDGL